MTIKRIIYFTFLSTLAVGSVFGQEGKAQAFTLKECIAYGLDNHLSVGVYTNNIEKARQEVREYTSYYLPQVNITAGLDMNVKLQQTVLPEGTFGPGTPEQRIAFGTKWNSDLTAMATQVIYNQSMIAGIEGAKKNKEMSHLQSNKNSEDLIYDIASSYYQVLVAQRQMDLLVSNKERLEEVLRVTKIQEEQGVARKIDVSQVQVSLNNVLSQISTLENALKISTNVLKINIGLESDDKLTITDSDVWLERETTLKQYDGFNYESTLEGRMQQLHLELLELNRRRIKAEFIPTLAFYARYGANTMAQKFPDLYDPLLDYSSIGLQLTWDVFTGFRRNAQVKQAAIEVANTELNFRLNKSLMNLQYENAESQSNEAQRTILTNKETMELAEEVYDNTTLQYQEGVASLSDLLNAEISYKEAQSNYINSLLQYYLADLTVRKANGTLTEYFNGL